MDSSLNPSQAKAVQTLQGPLLVLAGAGSGKTRVVTYRIANLIRSGVAADRILGVTFTNKAASEMQHRVGGLLGKRRKTRPLLATFHAYCLQVLRRHITRLGYPQRFAIYDYGDQHSAASSVLRAIRVDSARLRPGDLLSMISRWKSRSITSRDAQRIAETDAEHLAAVAFRRYERILKNHGAVDFDDLLLLTVQLFRDFPDILSQEAGLFDHLLVDEYQDTNATQYRIVRFLADGHRNLCVVGDDDQSIYRWRGAEVEHILRFRRDWPDATVVYLQANYRSTAQILQLANQLIQYNRSRFDKVLEAARPGGEKPRILQCKNEEQEARDVIQDIQRQLSKPGIEPRDIAVLFRTNEQPRVFEAEFRKANVPYVLIGGKSFFDRREVRDVLAYLRTIVAPHDETALLRVLNCPPRGVSDAAREKLIERAVQQAIPVWKVLRTQASEAAISAVARRGVESLVALIEQFRRRFRAERMAPTARSLLDAIGYQAYLHQQYSEPQDREARWAAVEQVINAIASYEQENERPTLTGFLDDTALGGSEFDNEKDRQLKRNSVALMTLHSAKGLEFPLVYMVGLEEGILPHQRSIDDEDSAAIDEERRLCYVGITRAQEQLTLSMALQRMKWGKPRDSIPSRFLFEMIGKAEQARPAARRKAAGRR